MHENKRSMIRCGYKTPFVRILNGSQYVADGLTRQRTAIRVRGEARFLVCCGAMSIQQMVLHGVVDGRNRGALVLAMRLMTASESMRSALRGYARLPADDLPATQADRYYLLFAAVGAAGEAIKTIRKASDNGHLSRSLLDGDARLTASWDKVHAQPAPRDVAVALRARDKYWAHWDVKVAESFVASLTGTQSDPPMAESLNYGDNATTAFQWVHRSWFADLEREFGAVTGDDLVALVQGMTGLVEDVNNLTATLILRVLRTSGFRTEIQPHPVVGQPLRQ